MTKACISKTKRAAKIWTLTEAICLSDRKSVRILLELQTPIGLLEQFVDSLQILDWRSWKNIKSIPSYNKVVNFIYSEKATKFCEIFTLVLSYIIVVPVKCKVNILQIAVAFSEYMNFKRPQPALLGCLLLLSQRAFNPHKRALRGCGVCTGLQEFSSHSDVVWCLLFN